MNATMDHLLDKRVYVSDPELGYPAIRRFFSDGERLDFDSYYRFAHLPVFAPDSPLAIAHGPADYVMGRHGPRFSLVLPIPAEKLLASDAFQTFDTALRHIRAGAKIDWSLQTRRQNMLHATLCNALNAADVISLAARTMDFFRYHQPFSIRIGGPLLGEKNTGRIYFTVYPEKRNGCNLFHTLQDSLEQPRTDLYLVGYYNFFEPLDAADTRALSEIMLSAAHTVTLEITVDHLWFLESHDDLCLSGRVIHTISRSGS